ncbi:MAG: guanine deaminase, partial [Actinomycetota bacterium]
RHVPPGTTCQPREVLTVRATIVQTPMSDRLEVLVDHLVVVDDDGTITGIRPATGDDDADVTLADDTVIVPGLVDTHIHAPQWPQLGTGLDLPLEQWLFDRTFPLEARCADPRYATSVWESMVPTLLAHGTTTAIYHGSIHEEANIALASTCIDHGQRAFIGRVAMDHPDGTPDWYRDHSPTAAVEASARSIDAIRALTDPLGLVAPIVTPRFVPACTDAALEGLGELAAATGTLVQTHCSESDWEHAYVIDRFGRTDTDVLDHFGLVREHTVLAHATHLTGADRSVIAQRGAGVAHCPLSNVYFANRPFSARAALDAGVPVGLGTDVAGGPSASLLAQCGHAVAASRRLADDGDQAARIDAVTAFWMATLGGAELVGLPVGLLTPGRQFDALALRLDRLGIDPDLDDDERMFEKMVRLAGRDDIAAVWVAGRRVATVPS